MPENKKEAKLGGSNWRPRVKLGPVVPRRSKLTESWTLLVYKTLVAHEGVHRVRLATAVSGLVLDCVRDKV